MGSIGGEWGREGGATSRGVGWGGAHAEARREGGATSTNRPVLSEPTKHAHIYHTHPSCLPIYICAMAELGLKTELYYCAHQLVEAHPKSAVSWFAVGCYYAAVRKNEAAQRCVLAFLSFPLNTHTHTQTHGCGGDGRGLGVDIDTRSDSIRTQTTRLKTRAAQKTTHTHTHTQVFPQGDQDGPPLRPCLDRLRERLRRAG